MRRALGWAPILGGLPAVAGIVGLYILSATPADDLPPVALFPHFDKLVHAGLYASLLTAFRPWRGWRRIPSEWLPGAIVGCVIAAVGDEWHQSNVPGRTADPLDLVADGVGIALAATVWAWGERRGRLRLFAGRT